MLEQLREFGNKRVVRFLFALFLIIPFGFFGIDFYFRTPVGGDTLASVLNARRSEDYRQHEFRQSIVDTAFVPRATLDSFIKLSEQTREVSVVNLSPESQLAKVQVKPEDVKKYYDAHAAEFTTPEQAKVE